MIKACNKITKRQTNINMRTKNVTILNTIILSFMRVSK